MKQLVTLTGLGSPLFESAVRGLGSLYHMFKADLQRRGCRLRDWTPSHDGEHLALTFSNRFFTYVKDAGGETPLDITKSIDPFNVLAPHLRTEVHLLENVVEYWQQADGVGNR